MKIFLLSIVLALSGCVQGERVNDATATRGRWMVEQMPGGTVTFDQGTVTIQDVAGCTVWWREKLTVPVVISYEATVIDQGGAFDRVSDLNCFWMASDPRNPDLFAAGHGRTGQFGTYDGLKTYYVGQGGNGNTSTRFRRYSGNGERPLLPENDLSDPSVLLVGNRTYQITLTALADGRVTYRCDGKLIFSYADPEPLRTGWFGLRTVKSHLQIRNLKITRP